MFPHLVLTCLSWQTAAVQACNRTSHFQCTSGDMECIPVAWVCDGVVDCESGNADEIGCGTARPAPGMYRWSRPVIVCSSGGYLEGCVCVGGGGGYVMQCIIPMLCYAS